MTRRRLLTGAVAMAPMVNFGTCRLFGAAGKTYRTAVVDLVANSFVIDMLGLLTMDWGQIRPLAKSAVEFPTRRLRAHAAIRREHRPPGR